MIILVVKIKEKFNLVNNFNKYFYKSSLFYNEIEDCLNF